MRNKTNAQPGKGLKTFVIYASLVSVVILVSLSVKMFFVVKQNKFDGRNINMAILKKDKVVAILGLNTSTKTITRLKIVDSNVGKSEIGKRLGIFVDAKISSGADLTDDSVDEIMLKSLTHVEETNTDLTVFDIGRIFLLLKTSFKSGQTMNVRTPLNENEIDSVVEQLFKNDLLAKENISIEIINASDTPGLGRRLDRIISGMGGNVVSVTTPRQRLRSSAIKYFGENTYTEKKLRKLLKINSEKAEGKSIADLVVIIGEDMKNPEAF